jgi:hypothetical protein
VIKTWDGQFTSTYGRVTDVHYYYYLFYCKTCLSQQQYLFPLKLNKKACTQYVEQNQMCQFALPPKFHVVLSIDYQVDLIWQSQLIFDRNRGLSKMSLQWFKHPGGVESSRIILISGGRPWGIGVKSNGFFLKSEHVFCKIMEKRCLTFQCQTRYALCQRLKNRFEIPAELWLLDIVIGN